MASTTIIRTDCVFSPADTYDDPDLNKVCIMSRLTHADGKTPDKRLTEPGVFHRHWKSLAPPPRTVGAWYKSAKTDADWRKFKNEYLAHLLQDGIREEVFRLIEMADSGPIALLCAETGPHRCHRRLLAEYCREIRPELELIIW